MKQHILKSFITIVTTLLVLTLVAVVYQQTYGKILANEQQEYGKVQVFNQSAQSSLAQLTEENKSLKEEGNAQVTQLQEKLAITEKKVEYQEAVIDVRNLFEQKKYKECREKINKIDPNILTMSIHLEYDSIKAKLVKKGY
ncbi:MAG: hypothetical protein LBM38_01240 [Clostridiales bacterium]|jgi:hypothetical protein|nr:hypothetical protein [Clostridiales bacterium]